jgi:hypothetical protein
MIIYSALQQAAPPEPSDEESVPQTAATARGGEGDAPGLLDTIVPAVVLGFNRLRLSGDLDELTETDVALAAGALTAGALDLDIYRWRTELGPLYSGEPLMWCYLAWLVADFVDSVVFQEDGAFARILTSVLDAQ